jgi:hypothetical protein
MAAINAEQRRLNALSKGEKQWRWGETLRAWRVLIAHDGDDHAAGAGAVELSEVD